MRNCALHKICEQCGDTFAPHSNVERRCDRCCTFTCFHCGKQYINRRNRPTRFCSLECTNAWQDTPQAKEEARRRTLTKRGGGKVIRCATCDQPFYVPKWRLEKNNTKYCCHACRNYHQDMKGINRTLRFPAVKEANSLELAGRRILDTLDLHYLEQQVIGGKFVVDVLLPDYALVIQWDGDFWHGNPAIYDTLWPIQETNIKRDIACNAYLAKSGYTVLRFWEHDVHNSSNLVSDEIQRVLANSVRT